MNLAVEVRATGSSAIVMCTGDVLLGQGADILRTTLYGLLRRYDRVTLNLQDVRRLDCAGLGAIASAAGIAASENKSLSVCGAFGVVDQVLTITRLNTIFQTYDPRETVAA